MSAEKKEESAILREENLEARKNYDLDSSGARRLMAAMCLGAVQDWLKAEQKLEEIKAKRTRFRGAYLEGYRLEAERMKKDCEEFFNSDIFMYMTGLDRHDTIQKISRLSSRLVIATIERGMKR